MKKGFTIFLAVLIGALALAVGLAIYDITVRELQLSDSWEQSQFAIFAADTGAECALYWDSKYTAVNDGTSGINNGGSGSIFATSTFDKAFGIPGADVIYCNEQDIVGGNDTTYNPVWEVNNPAPTATAATTTFKISLGSSTNAPCVTVAVGKYIANGLPRTTITADGYNTCNTAAPSRYQRTLQVNY